MHWEKFKPAVTLLGALCITSVAVHAQEKPRYYLGGAAGRLDYDMSPAHLVVPGATVIGQDDKQKAWKVFGGYQFNEHFGIEAGYTRLGRYAAGGNFGAAPYTITVKTRGYEVALVGTLPLNDKVAFFGKAGGYFSKSQTTATIPAVSRSASDHTIGSLMSAGIKYSFTRQFALRLEAERLGLGDRDHVYFYSLGALYAF